MRYLLTRTPVHLFAALALVVAVSACDSRSAPPDGSGPQDGTDESVVVQLLREPLDVEPFTLTDLNGRQLSSADWKGKVVLVNFWATWCPPCLAEIPDLIALQNKYRDQLVVVGVSEDEISPDVVKQFADDKKINYPIAMTTPALAERFTGIVALPTTFILDPDGRIAYKRVGLLHAGADRRGHASAGRHEPAGARRARRRSGAPERGRGRADQGHPRRRPLEPAAERKAEVLQALNSENCTCGCGLSVAKCRIDDPQCDVSLPVAKKIVAKYASAR